MHVIVLFTGSYALLLCVRAPQIIIKGRFWAEEGNIFFRNAWTLPPLQALFTSYAGYLNLPANAAALAARWLIPLEFAPYLTILIALAVQLIAPLLLLTSDDAWLRPLWVRLGGMLILLLAPQVGEGMLQTLHCQFQLALCCGLIIALEVPSGKARIVRLGLLFLGPLCGPVAIATLPLFLIRAWWDRSLPRLFQALALTGGAAIQLIFFFHDVPGRNHTLNATVILCVITLRYLEAPFRGLHHADTLAKLIRARLAGGRVPIRVLLLPFLTFGPVVVLTLWNRRARPAFWLLAAGAAIAGMTYIGALGGGLSMVDALGGERYVFIPQTLFGLTMLALAATYGGWIRALSSAVVLWLLVVGSHEYGHPWAVIADGPRWRNEIALWRGDPSHVIQLWPKGWTMTLARRP